MTRHALLLAALLPVHAGCGVTEVVDRAPGGTPILIRSPQPDQDDLEELDERWGVRTVLDLRGEKPGEGWYEEERRGVEAIGARWVHLDISGRQTPTPAEVERFLQLVEDPTGWPVLVHCEGGVHRTGVLVGLYRMQYQGWTAEQAIEEMEDRGFDWTIHDRDALKEFLRAYRRDPTRTLPGRPPAGERGPGQEGLPGRASADERGPRREGRPGSEQAPGGGAPAGSTPGPTPPGSTPPAAGSGQPIPNVPPPADRGPPAPPPGPPGPD